MTYTQVAVSAALITVIVDLLLLRTRLLQRRVFWVAYGIVLFFQLVTNGVLTGFRIVRYDGDAIIGTSQPVFLGQGRLFWAPIEDVLFGFALVTLTLVLWVWWGRRGLQATPQAGPPRGAFGRLAGADRLDPRGTGDGQST